MAAVGGVARLHDGRVIEESPEWQFSGWGLAARGLGGEAMTARPILASTRREEPEGGLVMMRRGWRCLVLVEGNGERGGSSGEGRMRCGMLRGSSGRLL
jgi:hypothetical protein